MQDWKNEPLFIVLRIGGVPNAGLHPTLRRPELSDARFFTSQLFQGLYFKKGFMGLSEDKRPGITCVHDPDDVQLPYWLSRDRPTIVVLILSANWGEMPGIHQKMNLIRRPDYSKSIVGILLDGMSNPNDLSPHAAPRFDHVFRFSSKGTISVSFFEALLRIRPDSTKSAIAPTRVLKAVLDPLPYPVALPSVFISHSSLDREIVDRLIIEPLKSAGARPWYSPTAIQPADDWERRIAEALKSCEWFVLVMSPNAAASKWVRIELAWAFKLRPDKVVPVLIGDCDLMDFHLQLQLLEYVDMRTPSEEAKRKLVGLLGAVER